VPSGYFTMWGMLILMALGAGGELMSQGNPLDWIHAAYPADDEHSDALHRCGETDAEFTRFSAQDREDCYRTVLRVTDHASSNIGGVW
jgi:hypothetical protein